MDNNEDRDQFNRKKDDDQPDHQINRNVDEDSLKNKEETENKNPNDDVTGGGMAIKGESSAASDDVSNERKRPPSPPPVPNPNHQLLDYIQGNDGTRIPVFYSESMKFSPSQTPVNNISITPYLDSGTFEDYRSMPNLVNGFVVGPIFQRGRFTGFSHDLMPVVPPLDNPPRNSRHQDNKVVQVGRFTVRKGSPDEGESDNQRDQEDDMELDHDQQGGSSSKDAKKAKK